MSAGYPTLTKIENISDKRTTLMEYWMSNFGFKFQLYKLYGEKPQSGQCRIRRFFATLRMTIHCFLWAPLRMTIHCFLWAPLRMTMKCPERQWKCPEFLTKTGHYETVSAMQYGSLPQSAIAQPDKESTSINESVISQLGSYNFTLPPSSNWIGHTILYWYRKEFQIMNWDRLCLKTSGAVCLRLRNRQSTCNSQYPFRDIGNMLSVTTPVREHQILVKKFKKLVLHGWMQVCFRLFNSKYRIYFGIISHIVQHQPAFSSCPLWSLFHNP